MEQLLAKKILELDIMELTRVLTQLRIENIEAYQLLKEKIEDL